MTQEDASLTEKQYKEGLAYLKRMGFTDKWPEYERFKAGDQWPPATDKTKNLPRPVFNIIKYIQNHKVSSVMNENIKMLFSPQEIIAEDEVLDGEAQTEMDKAAEGADKFTRFADTTWENIKQDELNEESLECAANIGTGIWHYYWDNNKKGGITTPWIGEMCGESLDPINVFFGNPQQRRVQKQPYIIISSRETVTAVKEEAKANKVAQEKVDLITGDKETQDEGYDSAKVEMNDVDKTTVLTKYWREENGTISLMKVSCGIIIKPRTQTEHRKYPIAVMQWDRRKKSIYGVGDTEGLIPNQKSINFLLAMQILSVQLTGWPKLKINKTYIKQQIQNVPGEVIYSDAPPGSSDIEYVTPGTISGYADKLVEQLIDYTKMLSSAQDAATGDMSKGQLNATAIMLLQKAAGVPIESIKKRFYRVMEDIGEIWEDFWKVKYNTNRRVMVKDDDGNEIPTLFNGSEYKDIGMQLKIDIGPSSSYSEELMMASLDKLFDGQHISLEDYLEFAPTNVVPFKDRLLKKIQAAAEQQAIMQQNADAIIAQLPPAEQQAFRSAPPEVQQQIINQLMSEQQGVPTPPTAPQPLQVVR